jgi:argininosuccinate lyase
VLREFHPSVGTDVFEVLSLNGSLEARKTVGGTAPQQVRTEIARHRQRLE